MGLMSALYDEIRPGDRVTIVDRFGSQRTGRAVMLGPGGWVLNMGGPHGTPAIATPKNVVDVRKSKTRLPKGAIAGSFAPRRSSRSSRRSRRSRPRYGEVKATPLYLNTLSLEDWAPNQPDQLWRRVEVVDRYDFDGRPRVSARILEGPEKGRVVTGLSPGQLKPTRGYGDRSTRRSRHGDTRGFNKYDWKPGDQVCRRGAKMVGEVLKVTPTARNHLMSDGVSRAHVRVRWSNGYEALVPEGGLVRA